MNNFGSVANNIDDVVLQGMCTRCGACIGVCPSDSIDLTEHCFPFVKSSCTSCGLCIKICGGIEVNFPEYCQKNYGRLHNLTDDAIGPVLYSEAMHSTDAEVLGKGASGGIVSQILISLFEQGHIDGAVVVGYSKANPLQPEAKLARCREDVLNCTQSKYSLFPVSHIYKNIINEPGRYAVVGLPCQIHSLYRWQEINQKLNERVVLIIGLFCHMNLEFDAVKFLASNKNISLSRISKLEFRGGDWPGVIRVTLDDGSIIPLHGGDIKDGAFNYLKKYYAAKRCSYCIDFSAELADISVSDPWLRDSNGEYIFKGGWSVAHIRTERGRKVIEEIKKRNEVKAQKIDRELIVRNNTAITYHKKRGAFIRIRRLKRKGRSFPNYYLDIPNLSLADNFREILYEISRFIVKYKFIKRVMLKINFSPFGWQLGRFKANLKKWKHRLTS